MKAKVFTILPELFPGFLGVSLTGKALSEGKWSLDVINIRDYAFDKYGSYTIWWRGRNDNAS